jgi:PAS domain S-box-containing protein
LPDQKTYFPNDVKVAVEDLAVALRGWIWETNVAGELVSISGELEEFIGTTPAEYLDLTSDQNSHPDGVSLETWNKYVGKFVNQEPFSDLVFRRRIAGEDRWFSSSGVPKYSQNDEYLGYRGVIRDITEQVNLSSKVERLSASIERMDETFVLWDADNKLVMANEAFRSVNSDFANGIEPGTKLKDYVRAGIEAGAFPASRGRENTWLKEHTHRLKFAHRPFEIERQNGRWFLCKVEPQQDGGWAVISSDITEQKRAEEEARQYTARFEQLIAGASDWIWQFDENFKLITISHTKEEAATIESRRFIGMGLDDLFPSNRKNDQSTYTFLAMLKARRSFREFVSQHSYGGKTIWLRSSAHPTFDDSGAFLGFHGISTDITEDKQSEFHAKTMADAMSETQEIFALWDADDRLAFYNRKFVESNKSIADKLQLGLSFRDFAKLQIEGNVMAVPEGSTMEEAIAMRENRHADIGLVSELRRTDGSWILVREHRLPDGSILSSGVDITEIKAHENDLRIAKEEAELANRSKTDFLANMSHELRTPLNAIIGFSEIMKDQMFGEMSNDRYLAYARDINSSGNLLLGIINEILDLSRVISGNAMLEEEDVNLAKVIGDSERLVATRAEEGGISLSREVSPYFERIRADRQKLTQVLLNLLTNAVKFSPKGSRVHVRAEILADGRPQIKVIDTGVGIDPKQIDRVFEPFAQINRSQTQGEQGTGLGLPLSKAFCELHGGSLELESEANKGTTAIVKLPADRVINGYSGETCG